MNRVLNLCSPQWNAVHLEGFVLDELLVQNQYYYELLVHEWKENITEKRKKELELLECMPTLHSRSISSLISGGTLGFNFIADAVEKVKHSVVNISVETGMELDYFVLTFSQETSKLFAKTTLTSSGSGFFIEPGFVLTNAHVISDMIDSSRVPRFLCILFHYYL